jgi:hypothetical protein
MWGIILALIVLVLSLFFWIFLAEPVYGSSGVRGTICMILFKIPFASILAELLHGCQIIPA